jgi:hypothetical protein
VGYEINPDFIPIIREKLQVDDPGLFDDATFVFASEPAISLDMDTLLAGLPYRFHDPHRMDKKVDVKKRRFGSKMDIDDLPDNDRGIGNETRPESQPDCFPLTYKTKMVLPETIDVPVVYYEKCKSGIAVEIPDGLNPNT